MKKLILVLLLINIPTAVFAKAVDIYYQNGSLSLLKITLPAMQNGTVNYEQTTTVINPKNMSYSVTHICMEMNQQATEQQFNDFVNNLQNAGANASVKGFKLKTLEHCYKNLSACFNNTKLCSGSAFVGSSAITEYITRGQMSVVLAELSPIKVQIEVSISEDTEITSLQQLGFNDSSDYCHSITLSANIVTGEANVSCVIKGSIFIDGKVLSWVRNNQGMWNCETNLSAEDKMKYAGRCN